MGKLDVLNENIKPNGTYALEQAQEAGKAANNGYRHKERFEEAEAALVWWRKIMINSPVGLHNILFVIFLVVDAILSWEIFRVLIEESGLILSEWSWVSWLAIAFFCLLINGWAVMTAHFIGKGWSSDVQAWERWNYLFIRKVQAPQTIIDQHMEKNKERAQWLAIVSGLLLFLIVFMTAYLRYDLVQKGQSDSLGFLSLVLIALPILVLIGELFTGDYVWYSLRLMLIRRERNKRHDYFLFYKELCSALDKEAVEYAARARRLNEPLEVSEDLERSIIRNKYRSAQDDNYIDPYFGKIGFTIRTNDRKPAADISVFGILPNGAKTGDFCTDKNGKVVLHWSGEWDHLVSLRVEGQDYLGPFQANAEHFIDLPDPVMEHTPCAKRDSHLM
jgi:hypothetical protein